MNIVTIVTTLYAILPSSQSFSITSKYQGSLALRSTQAASTVSPQLLRRPLSSLTALAKYRANLTRNTPTAHHVSSDSSAESLNTSHDEENDNNVAEMNDLFQILMESLDRWIVTGSMASRRKSYGIIKRIEQESKDPETAKRAIRMARRASMPISEPPEDNSTEESDANKPERKPTAWERKAWEEARSSSASKKKEVKRPVGVHIATGKPSALSQRVANKSSAPRREETMTPKAHADSKKELEEELARVIPAENGDATSSGSTSPPSNTLDIDKEAEMKTSELVAKAGSGSAFDGDTLGIGGLDNVLSEVKRRIWVPLAAPPSLLKELGINPVRGLLLYGEPGCGKTLLARSLGAILSPTRPVTVVSGPEVMDRFVGSSEANLREIFDNPPDIYDTYRIGAKDGGAAIADNALHVIVLDEFDAMARARGGSGGSGDQGDAGVARDSVVNQLLAKMDGVDELIVPTLVIGLTNKRSLIEPALLRPGRFEVQIEVPKPTTVAQRVSILNVHMSTMYKAGRVLVSDAPDGTPAAQKIKELLSNKDQGLPMSYDELKNHIATECEGMSGASLAGVARAAASSALERSVCDFAGWIGEGSEDGEKSTIADCIVTECDFMNAVTDILEGNKDGDGGEDAKDKKETDEEKETDDKTETNNATK